MNLDDIGYVVRDNEYEPPAEAILQLLDIAETDYGQIRLVDEAISTPRPWFLRVVAIALARAAKRPSDEALPNVWRLVLRLAAPVAASGDPAAIQSCLTALASLGETTECRRADYAERRVALELVWRSLTAEDVNTRAAGVHAVQTIRDFGELTDLFGVDGVIELRRRITEARCSAGSGYLASDLQSVERLLA